MRISRIAFVVVVQTSLLSAAEPLVPAISEDFSKLSPPPIEQAERIIRTKAIVGFAWVDEPVGRIILARHKNTICAFQFISFRRGNDAKASTAFVSGDENFWATANVIQQEIDGNALKANADRIKRIEYRKAPFYGLGRAFGFGAGNSRIKCGQGNLHWSYPTRIGIDFHKDMVTELAPTAWTSFEMVRLDDPKLKWYSPDERREWKEILIEDLPGN